MPDNDALNKIEVTPEMADVGMQVVSEHDPRFHTSKETAILVYRYMELKRREQR